MSVASMTGFARAEGYADGFGWVWEARSVNGRGLDVRCRVPQGFDQLEIAARNAVLERFKRGNVSLSLTVTRPQGGGLLEINRDVLDQVIALQEELADRIDHTNPRLGELLAIRGVVELVEPEEDKASRDRRVDAIADSLQTVLTELAAVRLEEGQRLLATLNERFDTLATLLEQAEVQAAEQIETLRHRLREQVALLLDSEAGLSEDRLAQELAVLGTKADIREELDRFGSHIAAARDLVAEGGSIGRRLEFLCQEFNREANTIGSKAADMGLTRTSLAFKAEIDQLREQVQNIE